jgi:hypothetical protein
MKRHGKTSAGSQRWQCMSCKATETHHINSDAKLLDVFLGWLLSGKLMSDMPGDGRTFRRKTSKFWQVWPMPPLIDEVHHVVFVDGIYLGRKAVILIARSKKFVLGWYLARTENSRAWMALMDRIAAPDVVVSDGGTGFEKARRRIWPDTKVQRCAFHAFCQVKRYTTSRPKLPAGAQFYMLAKDMLQIKDADQMSAWLSRYSAWCIYWHDFLQERTNIDGRLVLTHERLVNAKNSIDVLIRKGTLFTYLNPDLNSEGAIPATNNRIEGSVNAPLRQMLRDHRGLSFIRRIKAVFWWCYVHTECPLSSVGILKTMPADKDIENYYRNLHEQQQRHDTIPGWGDAVVWSEFHNSVPYRMDWD